MKVSREGRKLSREGRKEASKRREEELREDVGYRGAPGSRKMQTNEITYIIRDLVTSVSYR